MGVARTVRAHTSSRKPGLGQGVLEEMVAREVWHWLALNSSVDSGIRTVLFNHYSTPTQPRKEEEKEGTRRTFQGLQKNRGGLIGGLSVAHPSKGLNAHRAPIEEKVQRRDRKICCRTMPGTMCNGEQCTAPKDWGGGAKNEVERSSERESVSFGHAAMTTGL